MADGVREFSGVVDRRAFLGSCGAAAGVGLTAGLASNASAAVSSGNIRTFKGKYAIDGERIIDGFFASPRGKTNLDVVVVISPEGALGGAVEATARDYATRGFLAIAPNISTTYSSVRDRAAMIAAVKQDLPRLRGLPRGSGRVLIAA